MSQVIRYNDIGDKVQYLLPNVINVLDSIQKIGKVFPINGLLKQIEEHSTKI